MRTFKILSLVLPAPIVAGLAIANCTGEMGTYPQGDPFDQLHDQDWLVGCDPDNADACPEDYFICMTDDSGGKNCRGEVLPGGEGETWRCEAVDGSLRCWGDTMYDGEGWECVETGDGEVECSRIFFGDGGEDGAWVCEDRGEFTVCAFLEGEDNPGGDDDDDEFNDDGDYECPPGVEMPTEEFCGDGIDNDCDGQIDECEVLDCVCIPGAQRYCDWDPTYCGWGVQVCDEDGLSWGPCTEAEPPMACVAFGPIYSPAAEACCIEQGFCCQDFWDLDSDGDNAESVGNCIDIACIPAD